VRRAALVVAGALVLAACGQSDDDDAGGSSTTDGATTTTATVPDGTTTTLEPGSTTTQTDPTDPSTTPPADTEPRPPVGSVLEVVTPGGDVDGQTAESGDAILRAGVVTTEGTGKIHFRLDEKIELCILRAQGQAVVVPGDGPLVRLLRGEATCRTSPDGGAVQIQAGGVQIEVADPVFRLGIDESGALTGVGVAQGAVSVDGEILVGGQQAAWADGSLGEPGFVEMDEDLSFAGESLPPVNYVRPPAGESPTWDAAFSRGFFLVQVVQPEGRAIELTDAILGPFGNVLGAQVGVAETGRAPSDVAPVPGGEVGVIVTRTPVDGLPSVLLFEADGTAWYAQAAAGEDGVIDALRGYLAGTLQGPCPEGPGETPVQAGELVCYVAQYQSAYGGDAPTVPLDQFAPLLGL
jgi:hypothetical protein